MCAALFGLMLVCSTTTLPLSGMTEPATKDRAKAMSDEALRKNVFGSPFFIVDGEPFWGWDRLPMLEEWLKTGGW